MIAFNRNLIFVNEPDLDDGRRQESLENICVTEAVETVMFSLKTDWFPMSGQQVRYHSDVPFYQATGQFSWAFEIAGLLTLVWHVESRQITYQKGLGFVPEYLRFWLLHTFLPMVLELERTYRILHAGAVEIYGKAIVFSALSFGGKSTLTDYFLKQGHTLLSDDSLCIEKRGVTYNAVSSYPFYRPYREIGTLGYYTENVTTGSKPIHAVYCLEKAAPDTDVGIVVLKGVEKFKAFHYSSFIDFDFMKKERFAYFTQMAKHVPVFRLRIPWDMKRLPEVYDAVYRHLEDYHS